MTLLVTGWVALDVIETPFGRVSDALGGSATCAALAGSLFTDVRLLAVVGHDFPDQERAKLEGRRIDLEGLVSVDGETSRWGGRYGYDMNTRDTLFTVVGVNEGWSPVLPAAWETSETVFLAAGDPVLQRELMGRLPSARLKMVDTIKFFIEGQPEELRATIAEADMITLNDTEARQITGVPGIARAGRELLRLGPRGVIIKLGEYGAIFMGSDEYFVAPGYPLEEVIDPTGAGDAFAGGFLGYLDTAAAMTPAQVRRAMVYGSAVASFQVEGFGPARLLTLTRSEVDMRYAGFRQLTHFEERE